MPTLVMLPMLSGFLFPGRAMLPAQATTASFNDHSFGAVPARHVVPSAIARSAVLRRRAPSPEAFDGGLEMSLSVDELIALARSRGIVVPEDVNRNELLALLDMSAIAPVSPPPESLDLFPAEAERVNVFERVAPAVAYIQTKIVGGSPFSLRPSEYPAGSGSGFVWDDQGHVVTNFHVINGGPQGRPGRGADPPRKVTVKLQGMGEQELKATVVGYEADKDIAVLKIDPKNALGADNML